MPGPTPSNKPFPELPKALEWFSVQRFFVGLRQWASQFVIDFDPPSSIPSYSATANNLTIVLSWSPAKKAAVYRIHRGTSGDFAASTVIHEVSASKTGVAQYTFQDSQDFTQPTRFYWIVPLNERGMEGPKTGLISVTNFSVSATGTAGGINARATGTNSVAFGTDSVATGENTVAIGNDAEASGDSAIAIGDSSRAISDLDTAVGDDAEATGGGGTAVGQNATVAGTNAVGLGSSSVATDNNSIAVGVSAAVSSSGGNSGIAIGNSTTVSHSASVVIGAAASSSATNELTFGNPSTFHFSAARIGAAANGQIFRFSVTRAELTTIAAAAFTDTAIQIPANAVVYGVSVRVVTVIPTAATFDVGVAGATTRFATGRSAAAGTTYPGTDDGAARGYTAATSIRITPNLVPAAGTGQVRVTIHYYEITPPTS